MYEGKAISIGSWIRINSLWPGIWRVSRVLSGFNEDRWSLNSAPIQSSRILLFCDRVVNNDWKRSFKTQICEISYATLLAFDDASKLEAQLSADVRLREAFTKYQAAPHPIDLIANITLGGMNEETAAKFPVVCGQMLSHRIQAGLTVNEVLESLHQRDLLKYLSVNSARVTLQLRCIDHEVRAKEFVFREFRLLNR